MRYEDGRNFSRVRPPSVTRVLGIGLRFTFRGGENIHDGQDGDNGTDTLIT